MSENCDGAYNNGYREGLEEAIRTCVAVWEQFKESGNIAFAASCVKVRLLSKLRDNRP